MLTEITGAGSSACFHGFLPLLFYAHVCGPTLAGVFPCGRVLCCAVCSLRSLKSVRQQPLVSTILAVVFWSESVICGVMC